MQYTCKANVEAIKPLLSRRKNELLRRKFTIKSRPDKGPNLWERKTDKEVFTELEALYLSGVKT